MHRLALVWLGLLAAAPSAASEELLVVEGPASERVFVLEAPAVRGDEYAITGRVAYEGVEGDGYLEMWSVFADGSRYFSRTLDESGPLAKLRGSSQARPFVLPFFLTPEAPRPVSLELNVVLPARGRVTLDALRFTSGPGAAAAPGAWWSERTAGWIGGVAGSAVGVFGALAGVLASLGRGRRFVSAGLLALGVSGLALLAAGAVALALGQPYAVWYPLLLLGVLAPVLGFSLRGAVRRRYEAAALAR